MTNLIGTMKDTRTILFIDSNISDYQSLLAGLSNDVEVHLLNTEADGVLQIAATLQGRNGFDSIQIISHGSSGSLSLGSSVLNNGNLNNYTEALKQIGSSLTATGDILLYGCNVAQGDNGLAFINQLSSLTGADVAASEDLTGAVSQGGDWVLEASIGSVSIKPFNKQLFPSYNSILNGTLVGNIGFENGTDSWTFSDATTSAVGNYTAGYSNTWTIYPNDTHMAVVRPAGFSGERATVYSTLAVGSAGQIYLDSQFPNPTNYGYIYTDVALSAGQEFSMAWSYIATDYAPYNDASWVSFVNMDNLADVSMQIKVGAYPYVPSQVAILGATVLGTGNYITGDYGSTGWQTVSFKAGLSGTYHLGFAVFNLKDTILAPYLFVDQLPGVTRLNGVSFNPVDLPSAAPPPPTASVLTLNEDGVITIALSSVNPIVKFVVTESSGNGSLYYDSALTQIVNAPINAINNTAGLYFKPNENWSGITTFKYAAVDSQNTQSESATVSITINAVADTPVLTASASQTAIEGTSIQLTLTSSLMDNDDSESLAIKIFGAPQDAILSSGSKNDDGSWSLTSGQLAGLTLTPAINYNGEITLTVAATATEISNNSSTTKTETISTNVAPVNDAPILNDILSPALSTINEDVSDTDNPGSTIASIIVDGSITDVDGSAAEAIAVTAVNSFNGTWQYKVAAGSWTTFNFNTNIETALLLDSSDCIRFVPNSNYNGIISNGITFYAWDKSSGSVGNYLTIDGNRGGDKTLSLVSDTASIVVNDAVSSDEDTVIAINLSSPKVAEGFKVTSLPTYSTLYFDQGLTQAITAGNNTISVAPSSTTDPITATVYFKPNQNWNGNTFFNYETVVSDQYNATVSITVNAVADSPILQSSQFSPLLVSTATDGTHDEGSWSYSEGGHAISADGRYVVFTSANSDTNYSAGIFLKDTQTGEVTTLISVNSAGLPIESGSYAPSISADGRYVSFKTLSLGNTTSVWQQNIFLKDTAPNGIMTLISSSNGQDESYLLLDIGVAPAISADGRYVVYTTYSVEDNTQDVFFKDTTQNGVTTLISDEMPENSLNYAASISADGHYVVFKNFSHDDITDTWHQNVFLKDTTPNGIRTLISSSNGQGVGYLLFDVGNIPAISADGRYVVFATYNADNNTQDIFLKDITQNGITTLISNSSWPDSWYFGNAPAISADGRYVVFTTYDTTSDIRNVFLKDTTSNEIATLISANSYGLPGNADSYAPSISADGHYVTFTSEAGDLVSNDNNDDYDVFRVVNPFLATTVGNTQIPLNITTNLTDTDGSETLATKILGVPQDATLSSGSKNNDDGSWSLTSEQLAGLTLTLPTNFNASINLSINATATETSNNSVAINTQHIFIHTQFNDDSPRVIAPFFDQGISYNNTWSYNIASHFWDSVDDNLTYSVQYNYAALPEWMHFNNGVLTATPNIKNFGHNYMLHVNAVDSGGLSVSADFDVSVLNFDAGNLFFSMIGNDSIIGTAGIDTVSYAHSHQTITASLATSIVTGDGNDTLTSIENIIGSNFADSLMGSGSSNAMDGGSGSDTIDGGAGGDTLIGGTGNDFYIVDNELDVVKESNGTGIDSIESSISYTLPIHVERLALTESATNANVTGNNSGNSLIGNNGNNHLDGRSGADTMQGGAGNDIYIVDNIRDVIYEDSAHGGDGIDTVFSSVTYTLPANVENLTLTGRSAINGIGNYASIITLIGNSGNNILKGMSGIDVISGGAGNDVISGGMGRDSLTGGTGADRFKFTTINDSPKETPDVIEDFNLAKDKIDLSVIDANATTPEYNDGFSFIGTDAFSAAGQVRYTISGLNVLVEGDIDGANGADFQIQVNGVSSLVATHFLL